MTATAKQIERAKKAFAFRNDSELATFLGTTSPTIQNWREKESSLRLSKQNYVFKAVMEVLEIVLSSGAQSPQELHQFFMIRRDFLKGRSFREMIIEKAKDEDAVELIAYIVGSSAGIRLIENPPTAKASFDRSYGSLSDESCRRAARDNPSLLAELLKSSEDVIEKSVILEALPYSDDASFIGIISSYLDDFSPLVRESAVTALHAFAENSADLSEEKIFPALKKRMESEHSFAIKKSINEALKCHKFEF